MGRLPLIAEDLGLLDQEVYNLLRLCGYPGMSVYQFEPERLEALAEAAADEANEAEAFNRAVYSGTHDNQTLCGWLKDKTAQKAAEQERQRRSERRKLRRLRKNRWKLRLRIFCGCFIKRRPRW